MGAPQKQSVADLLASSMRRLLRESSSVDGFLSSAYDRARDDAVRVLKFYRGMKFPPDRCRTCDGKGGGIDSDDVGFTCSACDGTGKRKRKKAR